MRKWETILRFVLRFRSYARSLVLVLAQRRRRTTFNRNQAFGIDHERFHGNQRPVIELGGFLFDRSLYYYFFVLVGNAD